MSNYGNLCRDIDFGKREGEIPVKTFVKKMFKVPLKLVSDKKKTYDLEVLNKNYYKTPFVRKYGKTFEVKRDFTSDKTGNFFFEVWSSKKAGNPGCMFTCSADTLVIVRKKEFIFLKRAAFLCWVLENFYFNSKKAKKWKKSSSEGTSVSMRSVYISKNARGILLPITDIKSSNACIGVFSR